MPFRLSTEPPPPLRAGPRTLLVDLLAGASLAGLLIPESVAYAGLAGLSPTAGLVSLVCGLAVYALLGTSPVAAMAATSSSAAVLGSAVMSIAATPGADRAGLAGAVVMLAGAVGLLVRLLDLGSLTQYISRPVLRGFAFGLGCVVVLRQLAGMADIHAQATSGVSMVVAALEQGIPRPAGVLLGMVALIALGVLARLPRVPAALIVVLLGAGMQSVMDLESLGIPRVGTLQLELAPPQLPALSGEQWSRALQLSAALFLIVFAESYGSVQALRRADDPPLRVGRELEAVGWGNVLAGALGGTAVGAGFSATAANRAAGARTRLAGLCALMVTVLVFWQFRGLIERIPQPVLGAVVIHAMRHAVSWQRLRPFFRWQRDRMVAVAAVLAVFTFGILDGLILSIALSLGLLLRGLSGARVSELGRLDGGHSFVSRDLHPQAQPDPDVRVLRPEAPLFFGNAERIFAQAQAIALAAPLPRMVVLSLEESPDLDATVLEALGDFAATLGMRGIVLRLARVKSAPMQALSRLDAVPPLGRLDADLSVDDVIEAWRRHPPRAPDVVDALRSG